jgi:hypothetical protein
VISREFLADRRILFPADESASVRGWKDADPDIPILKQAKAEYAKLQ